MKYIAYFIINTLFLVVCFIVRAEDAGKNINVKKSNDVISAEKSVLKNEDSLNDGDGTDEDDEDDEEETSAKEEEEDDDAGEEEVDEQPEVEDIKDDDSNDEQEESNEVTNPKESKSSAITLRMINHKINQLKKSIEIENKEYVMHDKDKNLKILDSIIELMKNENDVDSDKETDLNEEDDTEKDETVDSKKENDVDAEETATEEEELNASKDLDKEEDDTEKDTEQDDIFDEEDE